MPVCATNLSNIAVADHCFELDAVNGRRGIAILSTLLTSTDCSETLSIVPFATSTLEGIVTSPIPDTTDIESTATSTADGIFTTLSSEKFYSIQTSVTPVPHNAESIVFGPVNTELMSLSTFASLTTLSSAGNVVETDVIFTSTVISNSTVTAVSTVIASSFSTIDSVTTVTFQPIP